MTQPTPITRLRDRYAEALTAAAHQCDGDCGLSERDCYDAHPITWSAMAGGTTHVDGSVVAIADTVMAVRDEEMARLRDLAAEADRIIDWHTTCASCARTLDSAYAETRRTETAEADLDTCRERYATSASNAMAELAAKDAELVAARSTIDRVQGLADWFAAHAGLGVSLEADGIRRAIADRLRDALGEQQAEPAGPPAHLAKGSNAEDCPACCAGPTPDYPWICPGPDTEPTTETTP